MKLCFHLHLHFILIILFLFSLVFADLESDKQTLLEFANVVPHNTKLNWSNDTNICTSWLGILCSSNGTRVSGIRLPAVGLAGPIPPNTLGKLESLKILSLRLNRLTGVLPNDILSHPSLHRLFLQHNNFSGNIPATFPPQISILDLSFNSFTGKIPDSIQNLTRLTSFNLQNNSLSGSIPDIKFSRLKHLNTSYNHLNGSIPFSFQNFPNSSFIGNSFLCGPPLNHCSPTVSPPPDHHHPPPTATSQKKNSKKLPSWVIIAIAVGGGVAVILLGFIIFFCCLKKRTKNVNRNVKSLTGQRSEKPSKEFGGEVEETENNNVVFFEGCFYSFDLEDLLRASAEVLGKGSFGTSYKATLEESVTVVVKRLKDVIVSKKEFESQMEILGRVDPHPNVVPLRAYYYSKDEKLLVYDFFSSGSLCTLLHGNRGADRTPVNWETRIKIALGAARSIAHIHAFNGPKFVHGNITSSNILINQTGDGCISDTGITPLVKFRHAIGYRAPEVPETRKHSHKSDVYSYGVLLLEMLTGKQPIGKQPVQSPGRDDPVDLPKWVQSVVREEWTAEVFDSELLMFQNIEEEMVQMLQIGMSCVVQVPENRPTMDEVVKMIEEVRGSGYETRPDLDENKSKDPNVQSP